MDHNGDDLITLINLLTPWFCYYLAPYLHLQTGATGTTTSSNAINQAVVYEAGAQRSDPKDDDANEFSTGHKPQGNAAGILNYVGLVRNVK